MLPSLCKKIIFTWPLNLSVIATGHVNLRNMFCLTLSTVEASSLPRAPARLFNCKKPLRAENASQHFISPIEPTENLLKQRIISAFLLLATES